MKVKAVKLYEKGFMTQPFAFGGEEGEDKFDKNVKYRSSLQNYLMTIRKAWIIKQKSSLPFAQA